MAKFPHTQRERERERHIHLELWPDIYRHISVASNQMPAESIFFINVCSFSVWPTLRHWSCFSLFSALDNAKCLKCCAWCCCRCCSRWLRALLCSSSIKSVGSEPLTNRRPTAAAAAAAAIAAVAIAVAAAVQVHCSLAPVSHGLRCYRHILLVRCCFFNSVCCTLLVVFFFSFQF